MRTDDTGNHENESGSEKPLRIFFGSMASLL